ncbi:MAG: DUF1887 family CARF protein [Gammaproteobacteria bacterium]|nr:DUF1887 family CARF protein [Gammaproteobacteria bacterium]
MRQFKTHICLVSQNEELNITPALHSGFKPQNVLLIHTSWHKEKAHHLALIFNRHQINTDFLEILNKHDIPKISSQINKAIINIINTSGQEENPIVLNITGGSKLLSIVTTELFFEHKLPIFYVNKETDILHFLPLKNDDSYQFHLEDRLKINDYLLAYGIKVKKNHQPEINVSSAHQKICEELIQNVDEYKKPLGKFNYYAAQTNKSYQVTLKHSDVKDQKFINLVNLFVDLHIIELNGKTLNFKNEKVRFFCNGGWLEEYVFLQLRDLKEQLLIQDIVIGLEIELPCGSRNELDVAFMANNRFYLIECKTKKYSGQSTGNNTLYKLDTLKNYGSTQSKAMLISYHTLTNSNRRRADDYELNIISAHKIKQLKKLIIQWVQ